MRVLIACEHSGVIRDKVIEAGHICTSCDLKPGEGLHTSSHYQGDVMNIIGWNWDLMIAHPVCRYLANSGVSWLHKDASRWPELFKAAEFFKKLWNADIPKICIENPIPHKYALQLIGELYTQTIQPYNFGDDASKRTCLWLKGLPKLKNTIYYEPKIIKYKGKPVKRWGNQAPFGTDKTSSGGNRAEIRSRTYEGIAKAIVDQWVINKF